MDTDTPHQEAQMNEPTRRARDAGGGTAARADPGGGHRTPRWVKVSGIVVVVLVVLAVVLVLAGGGNHGPGRHIGGGTPPAGVTEEHVPPSGRAGHAPPEDGR